MAKKKSVPAAPAAADPADDLQQEPLNEADQAEIDAEADAGWNDHATKDEAKDDDTTPGGEDTAPGDDDSEDNTDKLDETDPPAQGAPDPEDADLDLDADLEPTAENVEKVKHALKSLAGRAKKMKEEGDAEEARLNELRRRASEPAPAPTPDPKVEMDQLLAQFNLTEDEEKAFSQVETDYPEIAKALTVMSKKQAKQMVADLLPKVIQQHTSSLKTDNQSVARMVHNSMIAARHPKWNEDVRSADFRKFVDESPFKVGSKYAQVLEKGTAVEIIDMLNDYHTARQGKNNPADPPPKGKTELETKREAKLRAAQSVRHRTAGVPQHTRVDKNDGDAGWEDHKRRAK